MFSPQMMNTPPPNPLVFNKYRLRGTVTDPAQTRRRPPFGQVRTAVKCALCLANFIQFTDLCDIDEDEFVSYPPAFSPLIPTQLHSQTLPLNLHDSFDLSAGSDELYYDAHAASMFVDEDVLRPPTPSLGCSVCGTSSGSLAVLDPCTHPLCSACLTSALNIVGEKDMQCAVCKAKVNDFKIQKPGEIPRASEVPQADSVQSQNIHDAYKQTFGLSLSGTDDGLQDFIDRAQGASTPVGSGRPSHKSDERPVLRIDNVPWVCSNLQCYCKSFDLSDLTIRISHRPPSPSGSNIP